ncbi:MAG: cation:proton antiporter, partial [Pseudomonadota bacterium]|nr:cation:proton antiporter [Pseudomonadota bacterium]
MSVLIEAAIFLGCAVLAVPLFSRLGLGSILGYLAAGILIGPHLMGLIGNIEVVLHVGEFGVVLLLFLIGLELNPTRLWSLRRPILLIGGGQVAVTGALIATIAWGFGLGWPVAALVGLTLSLSSTAVASQLLSESGQLPTRHGRTALSVLLFQDIAVIPLLASVPLLAGVGAE